jgi:hypothetical protein
MPICPISRLSKHWPTTQHPDDKEAFIMMAEDMGMVLLHWICQYNDQFGAQPGLLNRVLLAVKGEADAMAVTGCDGGAW